VQAPVCQFRIAHSLDKSPSPIKKAFEVADHIVASVSNVHASVDGHIEQFGIKKQIGTDCAAPCGVCHFSANTDMIATVCDQHYAVSFLP